MEYTITELVQKLNSEVNEVYNIFKEFFGEDHVDLQNIITTEKLKEILRFVNVIPASVSVADDYCFLLSNTQYDNIIDVAEDDCISSVIVWWPEVTITNEYGKSVKIQDLYAKVEIDILGKIPYEYFGFKLNRSTYPISQFTSNYMHSHMQNIPTNNFTHFGNPCLGTGPIIGTINTLKNGFDEVMWRLFCQELSMYVTVESIAGHPWHRLESIGGKEEFKVLCSWENFTSDILIYNSFKDYIEEDNLKDFIRYYLDTYPPKFGIVNGHFIIVSSDYDIIIKTSNAFIEYYNAHPHLLSKDCLYEKNFLYHVTVEDGKFFKPKHRTGINISEHEGKEVCTFKGETVRLHIFDDAQTANYSTTILNPGIVTGIHSFITHIANYYAKLR